MELTHISEIDYQEIRFEQFDYFIAACGYQPRCCHLASNNSIRAVKRLLLSIDESDHMAERQANQKVFETCGFIPYRDSVHQTTIIEDLIKDICNQDKEQLNLLIDYSCMPKKWYAVIMDNITRDNFKSKKINLYLAYTPKIFEPEKKMAGTDFFGPIIEARHRLTKKKPVTVMAGLDNHSHLLHKALSEVNPRNLLAFVPVSRTDRAYTEAVAENNKSLLSKLDPTQIFRYDMYDPNAMNSLLTSCCLDHRMNHEVMIIPQGPKVFSMISLLISIRYPDVKLWEIIGKNRNAVQGKGLPSNNPIIVKASFLDDNDEEFDE
jgi:hypothetical protein